jgi:hypothetical protein
MRRIKIRVRHAAQFEFSPKHSSPALRYVGFWKSKFSPERQK